MNLILEQMLGVKVKTPREVAMKIEVATIPCGAEEGFKSYDVFRSRIAYDGQFKAYWWEEFRHIGRVYAFNSVHAMQRAKEKYGFYRMAVTASIHPLSPSSQSTKAALQSSMVLNNLSKVQGNKQ